MGLRLSVSRTNGQLDSALVCLYLLSLCDFESAGLGLGWPSSPGPFPRLPGPGRPGLFSIVSWFLEVSSTRGLCG